MAERDRARCLEPDPTSFASTKSIPTSCPCGVSTTTQCKPPSWVRTSAFSVSAQAAVADTRLKSGSTYGLCGVLASTTNRDALGTLPPHAPLARWQSSGLFILVLDEWVFVAVGRHRARDPSRTRVDYTQVNRPDERLT